MKTAGNPFLATFEALDFEHIADHPNILIAARFWDDDRYRAARICYRLMRYIDDYIDDYKSAHETIAVSDQGRFQRDVETWINDIRKKAGDDVVEQELLATFNTFKIPLWPMEDFARAMIYDINHDGFETLDTFLDYAQGASVAPAAIFVHLCGLRGTPGSYLEPAFDVREAARACAVFSYLVHIIRDFRKDQLNHLSYFADDKILQHGLTRKMLSDMAHGAPLTPGFRAMMSEYLKVADTYRIKTYEILKRIKPLVEPASQLSLEVIFELYLMVFERINPEKGTFSTEELNPTWQEVKERVQTIVESFQPA